MRKHKNNWIKEFLYSSLHDNPLPERKLKGYDSLGVDKFVPEIPRE